MKVILWICKIILYLLLLAAIIYAIIKFSWQETTHIIKYEKMPKMPSLTFYPLGPDLKKLRTENLASFKSIINLEIGRGLVKTALAFLGRTGTGSADPVFADFYQQGQYWPFFDAKYKDIWPECISQGFLDPEMVPSRCITFNPPMLSKLLKLEDIIILRYEFSLDFTKANSYLVEVHDLDQSSRNQRADRRKFLMISKDGPGFVQYELKHKKTVYRDRSNHKCDDDNLMSMTQCVDKAESKMIGCELPWLPTGETGLEECSSTLELTKYINLTKDNVDFVSQNLANELASQKCMPNCEENAWEAKMIKSGTLPGNYAAACGASCKVVAFSLRMEEVEVMKEVLLYTVFDFFADVGGYVGLLVGISIFQFLEGVFKTLCHMRENHSAKKRSI